MQDDIPSTGACLQAQEELAPPCIVRLFADGAGPPMTRLSAQEALGLGHLKGRMKMVTWTRLAGLGWVQLVVWG